MASRLVKPVIGSQELTVLVKPVISGYIREQELTVGIIYRTQLSTRDSYGYIHLSILLPLHTTSSAYCCCRESASGGVGLTFSLKH